MRKLDNAVNGWLSIVQFCEELGVPLSTAYKWFAAGTRTGRFPRHTKLPNGHIRIRREWLDRRADGSSRR